MYCIFQHLTFIQIHTEITKENYDYFYLSHSSNLWKLEFISSILASPLHCAVECKCIYAVYSRGCCLILSFVCFCVCAHMRIAFHTLWDYLLTSQMEIFLIDGSESWTASIQRTSKTAPYSTGPKSTIHVPFLSILVLYRTWELGMSSSSLPRFHMQSSAPVFKWTFSHGCATPSNCCWKSI